MEQKGTYNVGFVIGVNANLILVHIESIAVQNEICYVIRNKLRLLGEVIKIQGSTAFVQIFESPNGLRVGDKVEFTGSMFEVSLGPGLLSTNYDGLQNDLNKMEGILLHGGTYNDPLDDEKVWKYSPLAKVGDSVTAGSWLGEVTEHGISHKIMIPFAMDKTYTLDWIVKPGKYPITEVIAKVVDREGNKLNVSMRQKWPAKEAIKTYKSKQRPSHLLETGIRVFDMFCPMLEGGTGFIPGPFGCGKTVLQHLLSKQAKVDVVVIAACGERANEVVEIFTDFPQIDDPRTGRKLIERTVIVANTSNMPVAAREASVYTAMTIAEYYRAMGLKILLLADSTSRWAQALREMSNRMEELPGPDAFPMDLSATIANYYSRAGYVQLENGEFGSITFIGTVSPAGGNLKEPVTESTKKVARSFFALSQERADGKRYPAIDPIESYSKYLEYPEFAKTVSNDVSEQWIDMVNVCKAALYRGKEAKEQINILGDDGVPISFHEMFWKSELIDFVLLQQDAYDVIDNTSSLDRQLFMLQTIVDLLEKEKDFTDFEQVSKWYKHLINILKQLNYSEFKSDKFNKRLTELQVFVENIEITEH